MPLSIMGEKMNNIWLESSDARSTNDKMAHEDAILLNYFIEGDIDKLSYRIKEISKAVLDEIWRPESFTDSNDYCQHMMHFKPFLEDTFPIMIVGRIKSFDPMSLKGSLFKWVMSEILDNIQLYNGIYDGIFYGDLLVDGKVDDTIKCSCPVCQ